MKVIVGASFFLVVLISCQDIIEDESFNYSEGQFPKRTHRSQENTSRTDAINMSKDFLDDSDYFQWLANILAKDQTSYDYIDYEVEDEPLLKTAVDDTEQDVSTAGLQHPSEERFQTFNASSPLSDVKVNTENSYIGGNKNNSTEDTTTTTGLNKTKLLLNLQKQQLDQNIFSKEHRKNNEIKEKLTQGSAEYDSLSSTIETTSPGRTQAHSLSHFKEGTSKKPDTSVLPDSREIPILSYFTRPMPTYFEKVLLQEDTKKAATSETSILSYLKETSAQVETKSSQEISTHEISENLTPKFSETKRGTTETTAKEATEASVPSYSKANIAKNMQSSILKETTNKRFTETKKPHSDRTSGYSKSWLSIVSYSEESNPPKNLKSSISKETTKKEFTENKKPYFDRISDYSEPWLPIFSFSAEYGTHESMLYSDEQSTPHTRIVSPTYSEGGIAHQGKSSATVPYSEKGVPQDFLNVTSTQQPTLSCPEVVEAQEATSDEVLEESIGSTTTTTKATTSPRLLHSNITTVQGSTNTSITSTHQSGGIPLTYYTKETSTSALPFPETITEDNVMNNSMLRFLEGTTTTEDTEVPLVTTNLTRNESEQLFPAFSLATTTGNQTVGHCLVIISLLGVQFLILFLYNTLEMIFSCCKGRVLGKIICISVFGVAKLMLVFAYLAVQYFTDTQITVVNRT